MRWLCVIALVAGCGKSKASCKTEVTDLVAFLRAMDHSPTLIKIGDDTRLVGRPELPVLDTVEEAPVVYVYAKGLEFRGEHVSPADLAARLAAMATKTQSDLDAGKMPRRFVWDHRIYVAIDRDAPWSSALAVAGAAAANGYTKWIALFSKPSPVAAPPRSAISDELDKLERDEDSSNKASRYAKLMSDIIKSCPPMGKAFGQVSSVEGEDKAAVLIEAIEPALVACTCNLDVPSFRSAFFAVAGNLHPLTTLVITLDKAATPIAFPPATPWHDAGPKLAAGTAWLQ